MTVLQVRFDLTYLFVSYYLGVVEHLADRVAVIYLGHVVELGEVPDVYGRPLHPYTEALPSAIPTPDPDVRPQRIVLQGSVSPANPSPGCPFQTRCPYVQERCRHEPPPLRASAPGHLIACHRGAELHLAGVESSPAGSGKEQGRLQSIGPLAQNPPLMPERSLNQNE
ncbi:oligopeptide/dipeptide ABC transporter ATP-binding protein [Kribbella caucasensis]|nr:oligopeptide/dipeptide ABC transporter ATP-binding protein [Kribbella sp. VKM Ac-2527]